MNRMLDQLRKEMSIRRIGLYIVPTADDHESEYVGDFYALRRALTGFTGSAGIAVVTDKEALLWTDGRYFLQAEEQISETGFTLMKMDEPGVLTVPEYVENFVKSTGKNIGFFGETMNTADGIKYAKIAYEYEVELITPRTDILGEIWEQEGTRPARSCEPVWILEDCYAGQSVPEKLKMVRGKMKEKKAGYHLAGCLEDINWLLNIRGNDNGECKVCLCFLLMSQKDVFFYVNENAVSDEVRQRLEGYGVTICPYEQVYRDVSMLFDDSLLYDPHSVNYRLYENIDPLVTSIPEPNPEMFLKAVKNETELENLRKAHRLDAVAMIRFEKWLREQMAAGTPLTEIDASDYLDALRAKQEGFIDLSFDTISAYNANAAMLHYNAHNYPEPTKLAPEGFLLVDSGGHYLFGTTDITRTFVLGPVCPEWKKHYTLTLKGMLNLMNAVFLYGSKGITLDILARGPLWEEGINYRCGTGHGVGYVLSVHEPPNGFRWKEVPERLDSAVLEEGMVTTDEPGVYVENSHGIRIENELICRKDMANEYGQWMRFEPITYVPIDLEAVDTDYLSGKDVERLNDYHEMVYNTMAEYLTDEEREWLKVMTRKISKE